MNPKYTQFVGDNGIYQYKKPIVFYIRAVLMLLMTIGSGYLMVYFYQSTVERFVVWCFAILFLLLGGGFFASISRKLMIDTLRREIRMSAWLVGSEHTYPFENLKNTEVVSHYHNGIYIGQNIYLVFIDTVGKEVKLLVNQGTVSSTRTGKIIDELNDMLGIHDKTSIRD